MKCLVLRNNIGNSFLPALLICLLFFSGKVRAQNYGTWTWMKGANTANSTGVYGTQGLPAPGNTPPPLYEAIEFTDAQGRFWIYGGAGVGNFGSADLWMYDPASNNWTWVSGPGPTVNYAPPVYGTQGVPSSSTSPGFVGYGAIGWTDLSGHLWLFGGVSDLGWSNNLWKYDISLNQWTWMKGPGVLNDPGTFGVQGMPSLANVPPATIETAAGWVDNNGDLWMYGGGTASAIPSCNMWRYNIASNQWTWMNGAGAVNAPPVYGIQGVPSSTNTPGSRLPFARWTDDAGNFWMFGGISSDTAEFQDMWKFDVATNQWTWIAGSPTLFGNQNVFTTKCIPGNGIPRGLEETRATWIDDCGRLWCFGGYDNPSWPSGGWINLDILWAFDPTTAEFTFVGGSTTQFSSPGVFGTQGLAAATNYPPASCGSVAFQDSLGNFWMFGGGFYRNALWKFTPNPQCFPVNQVQIAPSATPNNICPTLTYAFSPGIGSNGISFQWNFGDPTSASNTSTLANPTHSFSTTGLYTITLIAQATNGCSIGSDTSTFLLDLTSSLPLSYSFSDTSCTAYTAPWGTLYTQSGSYSDTTTSANGCDSIVTLNLIIGALTQTLDSITSCGPYTSQAGIVYTTSTSFDTTLISSIGCDSLVNYVINILPPAFVEGIPSEITIARGDTVLLTAVGAESYQWSPSTGLSCTDCPSPLAAPQSSGTWVVTTTNASGCSAADSVRITVDFICNELFVPDIFSPNGIGNPENEKLCVYSNCIKSMELGIYNRWGELIFTTRTQADCWDGTHRGIPVTSGVYSYRIVVDQEDGKRIEKAGTITLSR